MYKILLILSFLFNIVHQNNSLAGWIISECEQMDTSNDLNLYVAPKNHGNQLHIDVYCHKKEPKGLKSKYYDFKQNNLSDEINKHIRNVKQLESISLNFHEVTEKYLEKIEELVHKYDPKKTDFKVNFKEKYKYLERRWENFYKETIEEINKNKLGESSSSSKNSEENENFYEENIIKN